MKSSLATSLLLALLSFSLPAQETFDLVIRGGRVVDGTGNPAFRADVAVRQGRIVEIGKVLGQGKVEADASGQIVAPGFIDVHTHAEEILDLPLGENFVRMGVTTLVLGNCGGSVLQVADLFRRVRETNVSVNVSTLIGHGTVRRAAMGGEFDRPPSAAELDQMRALVKVAMEQGAVGLSTGLIYLPGTFAKSEEIIELAKVVSAFGGIYATHMRDESSGIFQALEETFRIGREAGLRVEISHLKASSKPMWGRSGEILAVIEAARKQGVDVTHDQYVYPASSTGLATLVPAHAREGGKLRERLADADFKARLVEEMKASLKRGQREDYEYVAIAQCRTDPSLNGLRVPAATLKARGSQSLDDQIALVLDLVSKGGAQAVFFGIHADDLKRFLAHPNTMIASDSGVRKFQDGVPHPRGYGNNARVLGRYVRELGVLRLEDAIRRMTSLPATTFNLKDRGQLRVGAWADVVVFDPARVSDAATFEKPHQYATGFAHVFVNGIAVVKDDQHTKARPGVPVLLGR